MTQTKRVRVIFAVTLPLSVLLFANSCTSQRSVPDDRTVWFVHATDPHLYLYAAEDATDAVKKSTAFEESHDRDVLSQFFQHIRTLPQISGPPAFILITGDFGVDPCLIPNADTLKKPEKTRTLDDCVTKFDAKKRDDEVEALSALFAASPVRNIYFVAGNNDLPFETADDSGIAYFNQFFQDVQNKISTKNADVRLHNLTGCYGSRGGAISDCSPDILGTDYRMIGFPSYSFKNREQEHEKSPALQTAQFATFRALLDQAIKDGKKVIVATHIPEMDDPYYLARARYDDIKPEPSIDTDKDNPRSIYSTWNVQKSLLDEWTSVLASDSVVGVLAGHLHDGHKEIYERPYSWSTLKDHQMGFRKLFLAPPLSVKNQDGSPIQARGFSVVSLHSDHLGNRLYWYDGLSASFNPDSSAEPDSSARFHRLSLRHWIAGSFAWLWGVTIGLDRIATFFIALLTAFLTVVALWQIPASDDPLAKKPGGTDQADGNVDLKGGGTEGDSSPFSTRFGKTIIAGLGGLVVAEVTKALGDQKLGDDLKWYYIICFIAFFFILLLGLNLIRAAAEALRSRVAIVHYPLARLSRQPWWAYWPLRISHWFFSLRVPLLTFFDTFINLIQGKNQTTTHAFADALIEQQRNVIRVADTMRKKLTSLLQAKLKAAASSGREPGPVRVSISVLSADQSNVFYISRSAGSALLPFSKISLAWVSVFTGKIRWYESYYKGKGILLFDNSDGTIPNVPTQLRLDDYYEDRHADYQAFVVLPVPQPQRAFGSKYVKGAIHISFGSNEDFASVWKDSAVHVVPPTVAPQPAAGTAAVSPATSPSYPDPEHMLDTWCEDLKIQTALNDAIAVLGELLRAFNEVIYKNYVQPTQGD
jgi:hypothetical protein